MKELVQFLFSIGANTRAIELQFYSQDFESVLRTAIRYAKEDNYSQRNLSILKEIAKKYQMEEES